MNRTVKRIMMDKRLREQHNYNRGAENFDMTNYDHMKTRNPMSDSTEYARRAMDYARKAMDYAMNDHEYRGQDMRLADPIGTEPEYPYEMMWDGKQGVKGTGPYGIGGRLYSRGTDYYAGNNDYEMDGAHPSGLMHLKKRDFIKWEHHLENADGTKGKHFDSEHIKKTAEQMGVNYRGYDEKELCMTVNMLYSDFCLVLKSVIPQDKELVAYIKLAQAWLEDPDAPVEGSEKLALYYWCIVDDEE